MLMLHHAERTRVLVGWVWVHVKQVRMRIEAGIDDVKRCSLVYFLARRPTGVGESGGTGD